MSDTKTRMDEPETALIRRTAALARLSIADAEAERLGRDFARILEAFRKLAEFDDERATATPAVAGSGSDAARLRDDVERESLPPAAVLANAPEREGDFYRVPKTVGGEG